jgi:hypothetical protein
VKHLYWIVCGVLVLGLLIAWVVMVPADQARESKKKLDDQARELLNLDKRAHNELTGVFDLEKPDDIRRLHDDYLITPSWKPVLESFQGKYQDQIDQLQKQLLSRTAYLQKEVAPSTDFSAWYSAYIKASEALVQRLKDAGCLRLPKSLTTAAVSDAPSDESPPELRKIAGLYTRAGELPQPKEHPQLTARLRVMEMIADRLIAARIAIADNTAIGPTGRADDRASSPAVLVAVDWTAAANSSDYGHPVATTVSDLLGTRAISMKLTLEGSMSALLSATAALDHNAETDRPLITLGTATMMRRSDFTVGERDDAAAEPVRLELALAVVYFTDQPVPVTPDAGGGYPGGMPGGMPGMPGMMPPGMPGGPPGMPGGPR